MHIFISYSSRNIYIAQVVKSILEDNGFIVWLDKNKIRGSDEWEEKIYDALRDSFVVIVLLTPAAIASEWVQKEISFALGIFKPIIPIYVEFFENLNNELKKLNISHVQVIDCISREKSESDSEILEIVRLYYPLAKEIDLLVEGLRKGDGGTIIDALSKISGHKRRGKIALPHLYRVFEIDDWNVVEEAVQTLEHIADGSSIVPLINVLKRAWNEYQQNQSDMALHSLINLTLYLLGDLQAIEAGDLILEIFSQNTFHSLAAALALGEIKYVHASPVLIEAITSHEFAQNIQMACMMAITHLDPQKGKVSINDWIKAKLIDKTSHYSVNWTMDNFDLLEMQEVWGKYTTLSSCINEKIASTGGITAGFGACVLLGDLDDGTYANTLLNVLSLEPYKEYEHEIDGAVEGLILMDDRSVIGKLDKFRGKDEWLDYGLDSIEEQLSSS